MMISFYTSVAAISPVGDRALGIPIWGSCEA
jgi:hypothetical protein